mmetsp:Transcript_868/g.1358  ORF Transcript_868/g.1358 Transcript_868/m.1358 type:complete len:462 (+) Transcript_868:41-1426(+)
MNQKRGVPPQTAGSMKTEDLAAQDETYQDFQFPDYEGILPEQTDLIDDFDEDSYYKVSQVDKFANPSSTDTTDTRGDIIENPNIAFPLKRKSVYEGYQGNESIDSIPSIEEESPKKVNDEDWQDIPEHILTSHSAYAKSISRGKYIQMLRSYSQDTATGKKLELPLCFDFHCEERIRFLKLEKQYRKLMLVVQNSQIEKALFISRLRKKEKELMDAQKMIHQLGGIDQFHKQQEVKEKDDAERLAYRRALKQRISDLESSIDTQKTDYLHQINEYITRLDHYEQLKESLGLEAQKYKTAYEDQSTHVSSLEKQIESLKAENARLLAANPSSESVPIPQHPTPSNPPLTEVKDKRLITPELPSSSPIFIDLFAPLSHRKHQNSFQMFVHVNPSANSCSFSVPSLEDSSPKLASSVSHHSYPGVDVMESNMQHLLRLQANRRLQRSQGLLKRKIIHSKKKLVR